MTPRSQHIYYLMKGVPKDDNSRVFTQWIYNKIDVLADKPNSVVTKWGAQAALRHQEEDSQLAAIFSKLQRICVKCNSMYSWNSQKSRDSGTESESNNSYNEKKHHHKQTQEFYRCHTVGHIAQYCPSTALVEGGAPTETAATTMTITST
jgi:hypothetical protein